MKIIAGLLIVLAGLLLSAPASAQTRLTGTFTAAQACPALQSIKKATNPGNVTLTVGTAYKLIGGNKGERQIEPTQLHAITSELRQQTVMLHGLGTESAATKASVESVKARVDELRADQRKDMDGVHTRIGGISRELAATTAKVEIALKHVGTS